MVTAEAAASAPAVLLVGGSVDMNVCRCIGDFFNKPNLSILNLIAARLREGWTVNQYLDMYTFSESSSCLLHPRLIIF